MKKDKTIKYIAIAVLIIMLIGAAGIDAVQWFSDGRELNFTVSFTDFELIDDFNPQSLYTSGDVIRRSVSVKNTGTADFYVRIKAVFGSSDIEKACQVNWNEADYVYEDGYYYLTTPVAPRDKSPVLFDTIKITDGPALGGDFVPNMIIYAEIIPVHGATQYQDAWAAIIAEEN